MAQSSGQQVCRMVVSMMLSSHLRSGLAVVVAMAVSIGRTILCTYPRVPRHEGYKDLKLDEKRSLLQYLPSTRAKVPERA